MRLCLKKIIKQKPAFIIAICILSVTDLFSQVGISTTSITPNSSSILELRSTTLGFLPPRMTTTERDAISSPATGLVIYNISTNLLNFYNGSSWQISGGGTGVSSVSVTTANGVSGTVANATTTPAITLTLGAITPTSVAASGTVSGSNLSGTNTGDQTTVTGNAGSATLIGIADDNATNATMYPTWVTTNSGNQAQKTSSTKLSFNPSTGTLTSIAFVGNLTGNASTVTTNANLTGDVTSVGNATTIGTNKVTNAMSAQMAANTIKGNNTGSTANASDLTVTQLKAMLGIYTNVVTVDVPNSTTTAAKITELDETLAAGTYTFKYLIRYQSAAATTGVKFSVNHSGTVTAFVANVRWVDVSAVASTAAADQDEILSTGAVVGAFAARAKSTTGWGTTLSVDAANSDMLMIIEGLVVVTVSGDLQLYHGSEVAAATTVKTGSTVIITKVN
ncbi:MAG: hypothetical protein JWN83_1146 [Chitinophagaceae bacterium]|nr:hypothetical protein [Chitinophagaceae bacterium]